MVCSAAGRPMWAAKEQPEDLPKEPVGGGTGAMITRDIGSCDTFQDLEDVCNEWGSNFDFINTAAALVKYARLSKQLRAKNPKLFQRLVSLWLQLLPEADTRQCANVLWAFGSIGVAERQAWDSTWAEYIRNMQRDPVVPAQEISSVLWACGKLCKQRTPEDLQLLLEAFLQPAVLEAAAPQAVSNVALALTQLRQLDSWRAQLSEQQLLLLFGDAQLEALAANGTPQAVANVLMSLARLATGDVPVLSRERALQCAMHLLPAAVRGARSTWTAQAISTAVFAFGKLGMDPSDSQLVLFMDAVLRSVPRWCPASGVMDIRQLAEGCVRLQHRSEPLFLHFLQRGQQLLQPLPHSKRRLPAEREDIVVTSLSLALAGLDMQQYAAQVLDIVKSSGVGARAKLHPADSRRLWMLHTWLLTHGLCGGNGLSGIVSSEQLLRGQQEAAKRPNEQID